jgi:hypothetical protein
MTRWHAVVLPALTPVLLPAALASCASFTHADEFDVAASPPDTRLCIACPSRPDLRHPPCYAGANTAEGDQVVVFALRALDLGTRASGWRADYRVGFDQDCSDRPDGLPASCTPRIDTGWTSLAGGVDNALATQVLYPLIEASGVDFQAALNESLEAGRGTMVLVIDGWNGTIDDEHVGVRLLFATRVVNDDGRTAPSWEGDDEWEVVAERWDPAFPGRNVPATETHSDDAYVTGGILVWDARSIRPFQTTMPLGAARLDLALSNVAVYGQISTAGRPRKLINAALGGVWDSFLASRNASAIAQMAAGCDPCLARQLGPTIEGLLRTAPDMLLPTSPSPGVCDAISIGLLGSWVEVRRIAAIVPSSSLPSPCADAPPCSP